MALRWHSCAILCLALSAAAQAQDAEDNYGDDRQFPYHAFVNTDDVYVRSGPGQNYYPVSRLRRGETVEVYRHDPGGWYAIRPPADAFSWVSAEFVEPGEGRVATIKGEHVVARVGSNFSDIRDVIQIRLDEGERIEVIEAKRIGTGPAAQTWYKIAPPAGEFRWVSGQFIDEHAPEREVHKRNPNNNLLIARHAQRPDDEESPRNRDADRRVRDPDEGRLDRNRYDGDRYDHDRYADDNPRPAVRPSMRRNDNTDREPEERTSFVSRRSTSRQRSRGDSSLMAELEQIDLALSQEVTKDAAQWDLRPLRLQTDNLLSHSETALDRGRVRLVQRKIARFEDIKQRADAIAVAQLTTDARNQDVVRASLGGSMGVRTDMARFDGAGRLTQVYPAQNGVASFALVDKEGRITQFVTPAPGVNLRPFVGQEVGLQGTLGYMPDAHTPHVTAKRVTPAAVGSASGVLLR